MDFQSSFGFGLTRNGNVDAKKHPSGTRTVINEFILRRPLNALPSIIYGYCMRMSGSHLCKKQFQ